jgi:CMP-N,N'-diacetyllegionaminic acid synthase
MKIVSITLARGGSKEIKNKNLISLGGVPLLYYQVSACLGVESISESYVSSDDENILRYAKELGALPILRPPHMATDISSPEEALMHFCEEVDFDVLVFAQTTSPLTLSSDISKGVDMYEGGNYDSIFSVTKEHWIPRWNPDLTPVDWDPKNRPRRQDMTSTFIENGAFYITSRTFLEQNRNRYGGNIGIVELPLCRSFQVDTYDDIALIERLL